MSTQSNLENEVLTLCVSGDLISTNAEAVRNEAARLIEHPGSQAGRWGLFKLDLSTAKMVDSKGLNLIVALLKRVQKQGARLQVVYSDANIQRTLTFTRLDRHVELVKA